MTPPVRWTPMKPSRRARRRQARRRSETTRRGEGGMVTPIPKSWAPPCPHWARGNVPGSMVEGGSRWGSQCCGVCDQAPGSFLGSHSL